MASTQSKILRRAGALQRLSDRLGIQPADLHANAKGDPELALIITLERIADAVEQIPVAVEVKEEAPKTEAKTKAKSK